jgi:hypothetical protein
MDNGVGNGGGARRPSGSVRRWLWLNALALVMFGAFLVFITLQTVFGWQANNEELVQFHHPAQSLLSYLASGDFVEATFENWESEFLQMGSYVVLTAFLVQRGSPESNPLSGPDDDPRDPGQVSDDSPAPVRRGGAALTLYQNSLAVLLFALFALSFTLHLLGGHAAYDDEQALMGQPSISLLSFLGHPQFWFQSMQNWQSEFLSVGVLIVAGIYLRQHNSSQSKKVAEPHYVTGD